MVYQYGYQIPEQQWDYESWKQFQELLRKAEVFDQLMKQKDCHDEKKAEWYKKLEELMKEYPT